jgi:predicted acyltransferase
MVVVNFLGAFAVTPRVLRHTNDYCSYADTVMPHFLFAVGFALAIVWGRTATSNADSQRRTQWRLVRRSLTLAAVAFLLYFPWGTNNLTKQFFEPSFWFSVFKRDWFQTLTHIAATTLWMLPMLRWGLVGRSVWLATSILLHAFVSEIFYFHWVHASPGGIDGGPLGFLTWLIPASMGLWAGEAMQRLDPRTLEALPRASAKKTLRAKCLLAACVLMLLGYSMSCFTRHFDRNDRGIESSQKLAESPVLGLGFPTDSENNDSGTPHASSSGAWQHFLAEPPFVPPPSYPKRAWNYWMISQKAGALSYQIFAGGLSLLVFLIFDWTSERFRSRWNPLTTLGRNAIACYIAHGFLIDAISSGWLQKTSPESHVLLGLFLVLSATFGLAKFLEWRGIFLRL